MTGFFARVYVGTLPADSDVPWSVKYQPTTAVSIGEHALPLIRGPPSSSIPEEEAHNW